MRKERGKKRKQNGRMVRRQKGKVKMEERWTDRKKEGEKWKGGEEIQQTKRDRQEIGGRSLQVDERKVPKMNLIKKIDSSLECLHFLLR